MKIKVFISQSSSPALAMALKSFITNACVNTLDCWTSADIHDLPKGPDFPKKILTALNDVDVGIAILDHASIKSWWVNFETGFLYGRGKPVHGLLCCDMSHSQIQAKGHPLGANGTNFVFPTESDFLQFFISVLDEAKKRNNSTILTDEQLNINVSHWFKDFEKVYKEHCSTAQQVDFDELISEN